MSMVPDKPSGYAGAIAWLQRSNGSGLQGAVAILTLLILIAMWASVASITAQDRENSIGDAKLANANLARVLEEHTVRTLSAVDDLALRIKQHVEKDGRQFNLAKYYRDAMVDPALFIHTEIVDASGMVVQSSIPDFRPYYAGDFEHVTRHAERDTGSLFISKPLPAGTAKRWTIFATRRINRPDGSYGGVVGIGIDPYYFTGLYKDVSLGDNGVVSLTGRDGVVRARLADTGAAIGQDVSQGPLFRSYSAAESGNLVSSGMPDGIERIYSYRWVRGYPVAVLVGTSVAVVIEDSEGRRRSYYLAAALATLILLGIAAWMIMQASREQTLTREREAERCRLGAHHSAITHLIEIQNIAEFPQFLAELTRGVAQALALRRTSVWRMNEHATALECVCGYDAAPQRGAAKPSVLAAACPQYFAALADSRVVTAQDARNDSRTAELAADYLVPAGISSLMAVPFQIAGVARGVMSCEHAGPLRRWNPDDQTFALAAANLVALAYEKAERRLAQTALMRSEERYRMLFQSSPDAIMTLSPPSWKFTSGNAATLKMFGIGAEIAFVELGPWDLSPEIQSDGRSSADKAQEMITIAMREGSHFFDWTHRRLGGESFPATVLLTRMAHAGETFLQATVRDVSALKKTGEELRVSEQRLNLAAEAAGLSLFDWDIARGQVYLDAQWVKMLGIGDTAKWIDGIELDSIVQPEDLPRLREHRVEVLKGKADRFRCEHRVRTSSGEWKWIQSHGAVIARDKQGRAMRMLGFNADVSARVGREAEIKAMNAVLTTKAHELAAANRELEAYSYSVSHDLRAPLRSILGFGNILLNDNFAQLDREGQGRLQRILVASERMRQLIDDLLMLSKISRQPMSLRRIRLDLLCAESVFALREASPQRLVEVDIAPNLAVDADAGLIRVVVDNLLGNAWKFTGKRAQARISVGCELIDGKQVYFVRDNGAGFDMSYADRLFTPFQRMHTQQQFEGTGIGLATVKRIVERHRGRIWIESVMDQGATVYFTLGEPE